MSIRKSFCKLFRCMNDYDIAVRDCPTLTDVLCTISAGHNTRKAIAKKLGINYDEVTRRTDALELLGLIVEDKSQIPYIYKIN